MGENVIPVKNKRFAVRIVRPHQYLRREKQETVLSKQIGDTPTKTRRTRREKEADI